MPQMVGSEFNHYSLVAYPHLRDHVHIDPVPFSFGTESQVVDMSEDTTALEMSRGRGQHRPYGRPPERVRCHGVDAPVVRRTRPDDTDGHEQAHHHRLRRHADIHARRCDT